MVLLRRGFGRARAEEDSGAEPLGPGQQAVLAAVADVLLPGVLEAGFVDFANYWLRRPPFDRAPDWRPLLEAGADEIDGVAKRKHGAGFLDLDASTRHELVGKLANGDLDRPGFPGRLFFRRMTMLVMEAFLSDPAYGGNRGEVGWRFIGRHHHCWWAPRNPAFRYRKTAGDKKSGGG